MPTEPKTESLEAEAIQVAAKEEPVGAGVVESEDEGGDEGEAEASGGEVEPKKRSHHRTRERKGSVVDDILKSAKKLPPVVWVLGLGGAALAIDYFMEG